MTASEMHRRSEARSRCRRWTAWPRPGCATTISKCPPLCSPSRMALLTGRNSHSANFGVISEIATAFPGYTAMRPASVTMLPEILRLNGYSTAMFGKCHELGPWEVQRCRTVRPLAHE